MKNIDNISKIRKLALKQGIELIGFSLKEKFSTFTYRTASGVKTLAHRGTKGLRMEIKRLGG